MPNIDGSTYRFVLGKAKIQFLDAFYMIYSHKMIAKSPSSIQTYTVAAPKNCLRGISREQQISKGQKSKYLPQMADFCHFCFWLGYKGVESPTEENKCSLYPPFMPQQALNIHSKITMSSDVVLSYIVTALVPTMYTEVTMLLLWGNSAVTMEYPHSYSVGVPT